MKKQEKDEELKKDHQSKKETKNNTKKKVRKVISLMTPYPRQETWDIKTLYQLLPTRLRSETEVLIAPVKYEKLEESLQKHIRADAEKAGLLIARGYAILRVKNVIRNLSAKNMRDALEGVITSVKKVEKKFPPQSKRLIEIET